MSINRTQNTVRSHYTWETQNRFESPRDQSVWDRDHYFMRPTPRPRPITVRPRPRPRPKKWSRDQAGLETLTSLLR